MGTAVVTGVTTVMVEMIVMKIWLGKSASDDVGSDNPNKDDDNDDNEVVTKVSFSQWLNAASPNAFPRPRVIVFLVDFVKVLLMLRCKTQGYIELIIFMQMALIF